MKRCLFFFIVLGICGLGCARADEPVRAAQTRLRQDGFYFGNATGIYDAPTAAAITRYQIRKGLAISGKLDAATALALGVTLPKTTSSQPAISSEAWRALRNSDKEFLERLNSGAIPAPSVQPGTSPAISAPQPVLADSLNKSHPESPTVAPRTETPPNETSTRVGQATSHTDLTLERLRDYVGAFVLAGLDPQVGSELEFFGERVNYFGEPHVDRARIRRDLLRYDREWPERRFWLAGELQVKHQSPDLLRVTFPLRYELRNGDKAASGEVLKSLTLRGTAGDNLEIVAVSERKVRQR